MKFSGCKKVLHYTGKGYILATARKDTPYGYKNMMKEKVAGMAEKKKCCCGSASENIEMDEGMNKEQDKKQVEEQVSAEPAVPDCCRHKSKERSEKEFRDLVNRLARIEGQVRGVRKMLEENAYCLDIIVQVSAINSALNSFNRAILTNHLETCVMDEVKDGKTDKMEELIHVLPKLMR